MALGSPVGSLELLNINRLAASKIASHSDFLTATPVTRRRATCLLVVSSVRHDQSHGPGDSQVCLSQDLFETLSTPSAGASNPEILLIQGWLNFDFPLRAALFEAFCASSVFGLAVRFYVFIGSI